uniref:C2H2-type domain-containing protein n=1 Tax=Kwoniella dejecticola CBS 10117 TaxID=1296121 RepID=A0A1A5ZYS4_9TREE|nr:uncharacterized protein I303_06515 [Kwoniella dejecticola CBS 10117]OBR82957.1 hypothetical protein I303_06515 [Kwoniella dejecticola CBS 10117]
MTSIASSPLPHSPLPPSSPILSSAYDSLNPIQGAFEQKPKSKAKPKSKPKPKPKRKSQAHNMDLDDEIGDLLGDDAEDQDQDQNGAGPSEPIKGGQKVKTEEIDELVDDQEQRRPFQGGEEGAFKCEWGDCPEVNGTHNGLIEHVKDGCLKAFTRSDALQKHIRSQHLERPPKPAPPPPSVPSQSSSTPVTKTTGSGNPSKAKSNSKSRHPPIASTPLTRTPLDAIPQSDEDLILDDDIAEVLPRIRKREMMNPSPEEIEALSYVRSIFPRQTLDPTNPIPDPLDEPPTELGIPEEAQLLQTIPDRENPGAELDLLGRSEWQARYIMIKARLMLVEEENSMRRMELIQLLQAA